MNILFVSNDPKILEDNSPVQLRMRAYADEVAKIGGTLHIISRAAHTEEKTIGPLVLHGIGGNRFFALRTLKKRTEELVRSLPVDVISVQDPFEYGMIALQAIQGTPTKLHVQLHTDVFSPWFTRGSMRNSPKVHMPVVNKMRQKLADKVLPNAHAIRVVSQRIKDSLVARYGAGMERASVIPIQVSIDVPPPVPLPEPHYPFTMLTASRLEPEKRIEDILFAIAGAKFAYPMIQLVVVGEGSERRRLEKLVKKIHITENVRFLGWRDDARGLMQSAQAYIQASAYEGYSMTLVEAALSRVPIITSDVGIVGEVFKGNDAVLSAPPGDPTQLMQHMRTLIEDSRRRIELTMHASDAVKQHLASVRNQPADIIADIMRALV